MSGHTPGPWHHKFVNGEQLILPEGEGAVPLARAHKQTMSLSFGRGESPYPVQANACLIATAPELLNAAKTALDEWIIGSKRERVAYDLLNDAINKAEGRDA